MSAQILDSSGRVEVESLHEMYAKWACSDVRFRQALLANHDDIEAAKRRPAGQLWERLREWGEARG